MKMRLMLAVLVAFSLFVMPLVSAGLPVHVFPTDSDGAAQPDKGFKYAYGYPQDVNEAGCDSVTPHVTGINVVTNERGVGFFEAKHFSEFNNDGNDLNDVTDVPGYLCVYGPDGIGTDKATSLKFPDGSFMNSYVFDSVRVGDSVDSSAETAHLFVGYSRDHDTWNDLNIGALVRLKNNWVGGDQPSLLEALNASDDVIISFDYLGEIFANSLLAKSLLADRADVRGPLSVGGVVLLPKHHPKSVPPFEVLSNTSVQVARIGRSGQARFAGVTVNVDDPIAFEPGVRPFKVMGWDDNKEKIKEVAWIGREGAAYFGGKVQAKNLVVSDLAGTGIAYACLDGDGKLFRNHGGC